MEGEEGENGAVADSLLGFFQVFSHKTGGGAVG